MPVKKKQKQKKKIWEDHYEDQIRYNIPLAKEKNLAELIRASAKKYGGQKAFTQFMPNGMSASLSFAEIDSYSDDLYCYFVKALRLKAGTPIAIQAPNCLSYPIVAFACLKGQYPLVNINPLSTGQEVNRKLLDSGAEVLFIMDVFAEKLDDGLRFTKVHKVFSLKVTEYFNFVQHSLIRNVQRFVYKQLPPIKHRHWPIATILKEGRGLRISFPELLTDSSLQAENDDTALLQFTGGTTGTGKAAMLSHYNLLNNLAQIKEYCKNFVDDGEEMVLTALPLYHIFAFTVNFLFFYSIGAENILVPSPRPLSNLKKTFAKNEVTWFTGVNTLFNGLLNQTWFQQNPPKHLKMAVAGGMALQDSVAEKWQKLVGKRVVEGYGLTEASPVVSFNPLGGEIKVGSIGLPLSNTDIKIIDEKGRIAKKGEPGELCIYGPQVMKGYYYNEAETRNVLKGGWLKTGDIASVDDEGYIKIVDRKKDMINVSGFNVFPNDVENCIAAMPGVMEVAVIGVPDERSGEVPKAFIVKNDEKLQEKEVLKHCKQYLSAYKIPRHVEFRKDLPKTVVGKILRKDLRES